MKIVRIEGGLGAQIFGVMLCETLEKEGERVASDLGYFQMPPRKSKSKGEVSIFSWELGYYGIPISEFRFPQLKPSRWQKLLKKNQYLIDGNSLKNSWLKRSWNQDWSGSFPISEAHLSQAQEILAANQNPVVVHLRRGDYLNVASHMVGDSQVIDLLKKLRHWGKTHILLVSDSEVSIDRFQAELPDLHVAAFVVEDLFLCHALMRLASFLVISNSQFSLSAAILNRNRCIFMPKVWYQGAAKNIEAEILSMSNWVVF